jgi:hypothetical protein
MCWRNVVFSSRHGLNYYYYLDELRLQRVKVHIYLPTSIKRLKVFFHSEETPKA